MLSERYKNNLSKLNPDILLKIMHICADNLGMVDIDTYMNTMKITINEKN